MLAASVTITVPLRSRPTTPQRRLRTTTRRTRHRTSTHTARQPSTHSCPGRGLRPVPARMATLTRPGPTRDRSLRRRTRLRQSDRRALMRWPLGHHHLYHSRVAASAVVVAAHTLINTNSGDQASSSKAFHNINYPRVSQPTPFRPQRGLSWRALQCTSHRSLCHPTRHSRLYGHLRGPVGQNVSPRGRWTASSRHTGEGTLIRRRWHQQQPGAIWGCSHRQY